MADEPTLLAAFLADHDVPCPWCGYSLRGLTGVQCPECAASIELDVRRDRSEVAWRRWAIPTLAGPTAILLVLALQAFERYGGVLPTPYSELRRTLAWMHTAWFWLSGFACVAALVLLCLGRRSRIGPRARLQWLAFIWVIVGVSAALALGRQIVWMIP